MERHGQRMCAVHTNVQGCQDAVGNTSKSGGSKPNGPGRLVDQDNRAGRDHLHSTYSQRTSEERDADQMIGIAVHGLLLLPKQGDRSRRDGRHYTDRKVKGNAKTLAMLFQRFAPPDPWKGPVACEMVVGLPFRGRETALARDVGWTWSDTKPDSDNLPKQLLDVLQRCGFFINDSQVARLVVTKLRMERPVLHIQLFKLTQVRFGIDPGFVLRGPG